MDKQQQGASRAEGTASLVALMVSMARVTRVAPLALVATFLPVTTADARPVTFNTQQQVLATFGKHVFFDESLSTPGNKQGCVSCHAPEQGWTFPDSETNLGPVGAPGAKPGDRGKIKPPTVAYGSFVRHFQPCNEGNIFGIPEWCGGLFWDGRAEGTAPDGAYPQGNGAVSESVAWEDLQLNPRYYGDYAAFLGPLTDQALNPAQRPNVEQNAGEKKVCQQVKTAKYKKLYEQAFGEPVNCQNNPKHNPAYRVAFKRIALSLAAYQTSPDVNSFSSLRDLALYRELGCKGEVDYAEYVTPEICNALAWLKQDQNTWGKFPLAFVGLGLDAAEIRKINRGHDIFYGISSARGDLNDGNPGDRGLANGPISTGNPSFSGVGINALCVVCHADNPGDDGTEPRQLYTDQAYHNIGIPYNREIPDTLKGEIIGLKGHVDYNTSGSELHEGEFRSPTLRDVAKGEEDGFIKAYAHNGYFKSLKGIIHFYGSRDLKKRCDFVPQDEQRRVALGGPVIANYEVIDYPIVNATEAEAHANDCWPEPEFFNAAGFVVGQFDFYPEEEEALAAYIRALSDTHIAKAP